MRNELMHDLDQVAQSYDQQFAVTAPDAKLAYVRFPSGIVVDKRVWERIKDAPTVHPEGMFNLGTALRNALLSSRGE